MCDNHGLHANCRNAPNISQRADAYLRSPSYIPPAVCLGSEFFAGDL